MSEKSSRPSPPSYRPRRTALDLCSLLAPLLAGVEGLYDHIPLWFNITTMITGLLYVAASARAEPRWGGWSRLTLAVGASTILLGILALVRRWTESVS